MNYVPAFRKSKDHDGVVMRPWPLLAVSDAAAVELAKGQAQQCGWKLVQVTAENGRNVWRKR